VGLEERAAVRSTVVAGPTALVHPTAEAAQTADRSMPPRIPAAMRVAVEGVPRAAVPAARVAAAVPAARVAAEEAAVEVGQRVMAR
jgi:hypothetical protein